LNHSISAHFDKWSAEYLAGELAEKVGKIQGDSLWDIRCDSCAMPRVPPPVCLIREPWPSFVPEKAPVVYFAWNNGRVAYVGQSIAPASRFCFHRPIAVAVSWLGFPEEELNFAECFYIWLCRPPLNWSTWNSTRFHS
jgi:hypothetical protein